MLNQLTLGVQLVENGIRIALFAGSEGYYFKVFSAAFEKADGIGTQRHVHLLTCPIIDGNTHLKVLGTVPLL